MCQVTVAMKCSMQKGKEKDISLAWLLHLPCGNEIQLWACQIHVDLCVLVFPLSGVCGDPVLRGGTGMTELETCLLGGVGGLAGVLTTVACKLS